MITNEIAFNIRDDSESHEASVHLIDTSPGCENISYNIVKCLEAVSYLLPPQYSVINILAQCLNEHVSDTVLDPHTTELIKAVNRFLLRKD